MRSIYFSFQPLINGRKASTGSYRPLSIAARRASERLSLPIEAAVDGALITTTKRERARDVFAADRFAHTSPAFPHVLWSEANRSKRLSPGGCSGGCHPPPPHYHGWGVGFCLILLPLCTSHARGLANGRCIPVPVALGLASGSTVRRRRRRDPGGAARKLVSCLSAGQASTGH